MLCARNNRCQSGACRPTTPERRCKHAAPATTGARRSPAARFPSRRSTSLRPEPTTWLRSPALDDAGSLEPLTMQGKVLCTQRQQHMGGRFKRTHTHTPTTFNEVKTFEIMTDGKLKK